MSVYDRLLLTRHTHLLQVDEGYESDYDEWRLEAHV